MTSRARRIGVGICRKVAALVDVYWSWVRRCNFVLTMFKINSGSLINDTKINYVCTYVGLFLGLTCLGLSSWTFFDRFSFTYIRKIKNKFANKKRL